MGEEAAGRVLQRRRAHLGLLQRGGHLPQPGGLAQRAIDDVRALGLASGSPRACSRAAGRCRRGRRRRGVAVAVVVPPPRRRLRRARPARRAQLADAFLIGDDPSRSLAFPPLPNQSSRSMLISEGLMLLTAPDPTPGKYGGRLSLGLANVATWARVSGEDLLDDPGEFAAWLGRASAATPEEVETLSAAARQPTPRAPPRRSLACASWPRPCARSSTRGSRATPRRARPSTRSAGTSPRRCTARASRPATGCSRSTFPRRAARSTRPGSRRPARPRRCSDRAPIWRTSSAVRARTASSPSWTTAETRRAAGATPGCAATGPGLRDTTPARGTPAAAPEAISSNAGIT